MDERMPMIVLLALLALPWGAPDNQSVLADRVSKLTRDTIWKPVASVPIAFRTFHPQGMVKIGETLIVSSVDTSSRTGHLFKLDTRGRLITDVTIGEGAMYHPGGLDYDGKNIWVPVAEYRPDSQSIIYRVDPETLKATEVVRIADHIGAIVHNTDDRTLHGVSWGSRYFYRWTLDGDLRVTNANLPPQLLRTRNPSHYVDYQDCKYAGARRMLCTGVTEIRQGRNQSPFRLGGIELVDLADSRPVFQVPVLLWTTGGLDMTHNPVWIEPTDRGLRAYFMPEDDASTLYVFDVDPG